MALALQANLLSDTGARRTSNEDNGRVVIPENPETLAARGLLILVADGMGGHEGGEIASAIAADTVSDAYYESESENPGDALAEAVQAANTRIQQHAAAHPELAGMGTTFTGIALVNGCAYLAHVGDSRAYLVRGGGYYRMTEDHSTVHMLVKDGLMSPDDARLHIARNVILRAVGTHPEVEIERWDKPFPLQGGDCWVLCTDGLYDVLNDDEIGRIAANLEPEKACREFIRIALERNCGDNVTAGVVRVTEVGVKVTREVAV